jgi:hypothetical protein
MNAPIHHRPRLARLGTAGLSLLALISTALADDGRGPGAAAPAAQSSRHAKADRKDVGHVELERLARPAAAAQTAPPANGIAAAGKDKETATAVPKADVVNAFASTSWYVPPPPAKPEPPPKPTAPPLPFAFMGRYDDAAKAVVMLVKGDRLYTVSVGDIIDNTYRVDRITERAIELIYLPLQTKQDLPTGGV